MLEIDKMNLGISNNTLLIILKDLESIHSRQLTDQEKGLIERSKKILSEYEAEWK
jgi:hypothetical protein